MTASLAVRAMRSNAATFAALCAASPGAHTLTRPGVSAVVTPETPERPLFNAAFGLEPGALAGAYDELAAAYRDAGVGAWTTFVHPADECSIALLAARGHVLDGEPRLMGAPAAGVEVRAVDAEVVADPDPAVVAGLNDATYGYPGSFGRALRSFEGLRALVAVAGGEPVSCALANETAGDCHVTLVATLPSHRGRGLASALVAGLVRAAHGRGCETTTLVATRAGAPVYERLGYRDVGSLEMWERALPA
jgi:GNAT superfamily N-acetyltransferase